MASDERVQEKDEDDEVVGDSYMGRDWNRSRYEEESKTEKGLLLSVNEQEP